MSKSSKLWVYPLSLFMIVLGVFDIIADPRFSLVFEAEARKTYSIIYGLTFVVIGIYLLMVIFLSDSNIGDDDLTLVDILKAFAMFAIPSFLLCYIGYLSIYSGLHLNEYTIIDQYDIFSSHSHFLF